MDTQAIKFQADVVAKLSNDLAFARSNIEKALGKFGQNTDSSVIVNGVEVKFLTLNFAHEPAVKKGMETIQSEVVRILTIHRDQIASQLEGAKWKLRQLAKD